MYYPNHLGMVWGGGLLALLFNIVAWVVIIWAIIAVIRILGGGRHRPYRGHWGNSALSILDERYAKGEINKEEYEARKKDLLS